MGKRRPTDPDHKARFQFGVQCACSCGWYSAVWFGQGAKFSASSEWHSHRDKCDQAKKD